MHVMRIIDPVGVELRRKRRICRKIYLSIGPNHVWHVDGYDKLKPYGFGVHGCIDGFSRRLMWLKVGTTNNNPRVVASYFVNCVQSVGGCPTILQADPGTENIVIGALQCTFRRQAKDAFGAEKSFQIVKSVFNQRIEAWWSLFRRQKAQLWIDLFKQLELFGAFKKDNLLDMYCLRYCFMPIIQRELDILVELWNNHYISKSRQAVCPGGRPIFMYDIPEANGAMDCLYQVDTEDIDWAFSKCESDTRSGCRHFDAFAKTYFSEMHLFDAQTTDEALKQFFDLSSLMITVY